MNSIEELLSHKSPASHGFLAGGGEMGRLMRSHDWASTPLGAVERWPQSLRTSVSTCLNSRFAILIWWGKDLVMLYNEAYTPILGSKHPKSLGSPGKEVWPEIWHIIGPMLEGVLERGEATWSDDLLLELDRDGYPEECYFTFSYSPIRDESGGVGGIFTPVQETTERVIGERRLHTLRDLAALQASNAQNVQEACQLATRALSQNQKDIPFAALYLVDAQSQSAHLCGAAGISPGSSLAPHRVSAHPSEKPWFCLKAALENSFELVTIPAQIQDVPRGAWSVPSSQAAIVPLTVSGQRVGFLLLAVSPRKKLDGAYQDFFRLIAGHVSTAIAEVRAFEEERKRVERLEELDHAKTTFFSNVSHEFRTPLTLMLGPLEDVLRSDKTLSPEAASEIEVAHRNALRLQKLVNTLLDFSRIQAGGVQASYEPIDASVLTAELASLFRSAIERAGLQLIVDCEPLPQRVYLDREMWEKIVLNLLSNALKFTMSGSIRVSLRSNGHELQLLVNDTGIGIEEKSLPHIFDRFHRVENAHGRTSEGTGIGLALVSELAKLQGGSVEVESQLGKGSTFRVSIPLRVGQAQEKYGSSPAASTRTRPERYVEEAQRWDRDEAERRSESVSADSQGNTPVRERILLADDNADMRVYMTRVLSEQYDVQSVSNGAEALAIAQESSPDLIVSDVMMPDLDGFGLLKEIRARAETRTIPVILISARAGEESRVEGLDAGADDYLVKPFTARELLARVGTHIAMTRMRKEVEEQLKQSEQRFRKTFANAVTGMALTNTHGRFLEVNRAFTEITGYSEPELLTLTAQGITHPEDVPRHAELVGKLLAGNLESFVIEKRYVRKGGAVVWIRNSVSILPGTHDRPANLIKIVEDITERKQAEEENQRLLVLEREARSTAELLNRVGPILLMERDMSKLVQSVTDLATKLTGAEFGAFFHNVVNEKGESYMLYTLSGVPREAFDKFPMPRNTDVFAPTFNGEGVVRSDDITSDPRYGRNAPYFGMPKGHLPVRSYLAVPVVSRSGEVLGGLFFGHSKEGRFSERHETVITGLAAQAAIAMDNATLFQQAHRAQEELRRANAELMRANTDLEQFAYSASHDLQEPLRMVAIYSQMLRKKYEGRLDAKADQFITYLVQGAHRMEALVRDLLAYTRATGHFDGAPHVVDATASLNKALDNLKAAIQETGTQITADDLPVIQMQEVHLEQLFQNLIGNAIKYHNTQPPRIHVSAVSEQDHWVFSVRDNGIGIDPEYHESIFGLFKRLHAGAEYPGTGIGLAICHKIVERYGGRIWVESVPGEGATFFFKLPKTDATSVF
jgi:PAS domain S-box-containing protein